MGTLVGHVAPGVGFLVIGLWHLFNHIRLYAVRPGSYRARPWFPAPLARYLEPALIIAGSLASIAMELFIGPEAHQPFDSDGSIPSNHLHNFEHASISLSLLLYAAFAIHLDRDRRRSSTTTHGAARSLARDALTLLLAAAALAQELLIFHLHSADHMGVEGQYHWLLQCVVAVSLATTLLGIAHPASFAVAFVRSVSLVLQGVWFVAMGVMLWTPSLIPKGCFLNYEEGHHVVRCRDADALGRAKSLVNLQFSWYVSATAVFAVAAFLFITKLYPQEPDYVPLVKAADEDDDDLEAQKLAESQSFARMRDGMKPIELER
ncbi:hypothetical protein ACMD2_04184 [Ananas comosus]|uniref:Transmembrane protein 45B n=1 Tax=Ananas comosus TaxID=4615 RepID=A0A199W7N5_ANACO|nr:hypothetical protein ACMD2_04184 [Ananas comosus]